jgi:hypothetical protein
MSWRLLLLAPICLLTHQGKAQTEPFPFEISFWQVVQSNRFQANSSLRIDQHPSSWKSFVPDTADSIDSLRMNFTVDTIQWNFVLRGLNYEVRFPNDVSVFFGKDRKELQDLMLKSLQGINTSTFPVDTSEIHLEDTVWISEGVRYDLLKTLKVMNKTDSTLICSASYPIESLINSFSDTSQCRGLFPLVLIINRYGFEKDTILTDVPSFLRATGSTNWLKWVAQNENELTVLLQHPFFSLDHMLYLKLDRKDMKTFWYAELHSFIPTHNLLNLYRTHKQMDGAAKFVVE